jgi:HEAT repeat protein
MKTRCVSIVCGLIAAFVFVPACSSLRSHEPRYEGKQLSVWMAELSKQTEEETPYTQGWAREATWTNVVQGVGTNGLPYYLRWMVDSDDQLRLYWAGHAIVILGPAAEPAIPTLAGWLNKGHVGYAAGRGLAAIGPAAIPALIEAVETLTNRGQSMAIEILGEFGPLAKPVVPDLIQIIKSDSPMAWPAMQSLVEIETNPAVVLPLLALHVADTNTAVGNSAIGAAYALGRLGNAGVPMLLMMLTNETRIVHASAAGALDPDFQKYSKDKNVTNAPGFLRLCLDYLKMTSRAGIRAYSKGDYVAAAETAAQYTNTPDANIREAANNVLNILRPLAETNVPQSKLDQQEGVFMPKPALPQEH